MWKRDIALTIRPSELESSSEFYQQFFCAGGGCEKEKARSLVLNRQILCGRRLVAWQDVLAEWTQARSSFYETAELFRAQLLSSSTFTKAQRLILLSLDQIHALYYCFL